MGGNGITEQVRLRVKVCVFVRERERECVCVYCRFLLSFVNASKRIRSRSIWLKSFTEMQRLRKRQLSKRFRNTAAGRSNIRGNIEHTASDNRQHLAERL
jgi:hypothetical protein